MTEEKIKLPIRSALIPVYYRNFHCLAQDCRDTCCQNWAITFDKKDYLRLRRLDVPPAMRELIEKVVRRERKGEHDGMQYGKFELDPQSRRCPLQTPEGLCSLQLACGHEALPLVCTSYPRKVGYSTAAKEYSLSPSCEGVLQQLWDLPEGVEFVEDPLPKAEHRNVNIARDENLWLSFVPVRGLFIDILQSRTIPLTERMLYLGVAIQRLQKEDWDSFDPDSWTGRTALPSGSDAVRGMTVDIPGNRDMYLTQNLDVLSSIAASGREKWTDEIFNTLEIKQKLVIESKEDGGQDQNAQIIVNFSKKAYDEALAQFQAAFSDYEYFFENLMVASALYMNFPNLNDKETLWKSYVSLCNLYSFYRFVSVLGCKDEATKERLFHMIVMASRTTLHNRTRLDGFQEQLFQHDSSTLAHMAILLRWD